MIKIYGNDGQVVIGEDKYEIVYQNSNILTVKYNNKIYELKIHSSNANEIVIYPEDILSVKENGPVIPIAPMTLRFAFSRESSDPTTLGTAGTWVKVENYPEYDNVWDWTYDDANWRSVMAYKLTNYFDPDVRVIGAGDTSKVTDLTYFFDNCSGLTYVDAKFDTSSAVTTEAMFVNCPNLVSVPQFDTHNVTMMSGMFQNGHSLKSLPLFDTSKANDVSNLVRDCENLESGMLDFYNKAKTTATIYSNCFTGAGTNTESGRAERAQIPQSWGGDL